MTAPTESLNRAATRRRRRRRPGRAVAGWLHRLLVPLLGAVAVLFATGLYLGSVTALEHITGRLYQTWFYLFVFLAHLAVGLLAIIPLLLFVVGHWRRGRGLPNRRAARIGVALAAVTVGVAASGVLLTRLEPLVVRDPDIRRVAYWIHVTLPIVAGWLFVLHRLAGPRLRWRVGLGFAGAAAAVTVVLVALHARDPRHVGVGPASGAAYFEPSLARTASGAFIAADTLMMDDYCRECHRDTHERWAHSAHRVSSFNNPLYLFSVRETRRVALARDGDVQASRFCAGCHDPVPFFSGAFDRPDFDDVRDPTAAAGITCTSCHGVVAINSVRGNADYTIEEPLHYPFARSDSRLLRWVNRQLVKAKPALHKRTFLKPLHKSAAFCGSCHKVHLPEALNRYKWLRGQNHYDSFLLSGVSGGGVSSFYYPERAQTGCNGCHMPVRDSDDFGARELDDDGRLEVHDHLFPGANTAIPHLLGMPAWAGETQRAFLEGSLRVDIFAVRPGRSIDAAIDGPIGGSVDHEGAALTPLAPGQTYLIDVVLRTLTLGHHFTQGTADSNEVWLEITARAGDRVIGRSGAISDNDHVDPWAHFVNAYVLDREGRRVDRRNAQDIFVALYNNQIPPGAADVVHYALAIPADATGPITIDARLRYRKFDTTYMRHAFGPDRANDLPITTIAADRVILPLGGPEGPAAAISQPDRIASGVPAWQRWNDYGIGLLRKGEGAVGAAAAGELRQAKDAFARVEALGRADGAMNLARAHLREGLLDEAAAALTRAQAMTPRPPPWTAAWLSGHIDRQTGHLSEALAAFESILVPTAETTRRGFDFSRDYRLLGDIGQTRVELALARRDDPAARRALEDSAIAAFLAVLALDPENARAHYNLAALYDAHDRGDEAAAHRALYDTYRVDDNARDRAVTAHRRQNPAADHAAESVVIYDLRP